MSPPTSDTGLARARTHAKQPPTKYTFARVFGPHDSQSNSQASFFQETTLPMVHNLLQGESGLIFTYGVTNSGKSYTVSGGDEANEAGILPRALDVTFNSIQGFQSKSALAPVGLYGVERCSPTDPVKPGASSSAPPSLDPWSVPSVKKRVTETNKRLAAPMAYYRDSTKVKVDRNYRYSIWISYVEVYNEKLFDLLDVNPSSGGLSPSYGGMTRSDSIRASNWSIAGSASSTNLSDLGNGPITLARRPLALKTDPEGGGKYVAGLREVRVSTVEEGRELLQRGQENRVVFATMANRASSRSHGVFTIKVLKEHAADADDTTACTVSRLSIVDLAGSERISNTSTSGQRQKEAGSINKSLMCLGQCLETLRKNQVRAASMIPMLTPMASAQFEGSITATPPTVKQPGKIRRPSVIPFRHSKLTELFQPFFTGEGRTVMIVNANPYDTGFDENSHVMKFSAAAKEVQTQSHPGSSLSRGKVVHRIKGDVPFPILTGNGGESDVGSTPPGTPRKHSLLKGSRVHQLSTASAASSRRPTDFSQEVAIIEESDDDEEEEDDGAEADRDDGGDGAFIDALIARHEELRERLFEAEMRCALIESEVREELAAEMAERFVEMEARYTERILGEVERSEDFFNKKIDLLVSSSSSERQSRSMSPTQQEHYQTETPRASRMGPRTNPVSDEEESNAAGDEISGEEASTDDEEQGRVDVNLVKANELISRDELDLSLSLDPIAPLRGKSSAVSTEETSAKFKDDEEAAVDGSLAVIEGDIDNLRIAAATREEQETSAANGDTTNEDEDTASLSEYEEDGDEDDFSSEQEYYDEDDESFKQEESEEEEEEEIRPARRRRSNAAAFRCKSLETGAQTASFKATAAVSRRSTDALATKKPLAPSSGRISNTAANAKPKQQSVKNRVKKVAVHENESESEAELLVLRNAGAQSPEESLAVADGDPGTAKAKKRVLLRGGSGGVAGPGGISKARSNQPQQRAAHTSRAAFAASKGMLDRQTQRRLLADVGADTSSYDLDMDESM